MQKILDGGLDGYVWRVNFGDQGPFALKVVSPLTPSYRILLLTHFLSFGMQNGPFSSTTTPPSENARTMLFCR